MLLYFLLGLIAIGVLVLSDIGKKILYVIGCILLLIGAGYGIFYMAIIIYGIGITINDYGPFSIFKEYWLQIVGGIIILWIFFKKKSNLNKNTIPNEQSDAYSVLKKVHSNKTNKKVI